jgi:hypothetical protein
VIWPIGVAEPNRRDAAVLRGRVQPRARDAQQPHSLSAGQQFGRGVDGHHEVLGRIYRAVAAPSSDPASADGQSMRRAWSTKAVGYAATRIRALRRAASVSAAAAHERLLKAAVEARGLGDLGVAELALDVQERLARGQRGELAVAEVGQDAQLAMPAVVLPGALLEVARRAYR